ncbi:MAG: sulfite oxidase heme-binding subunit YedZ [Rhizobiaceae bacterium]
MTPWTDRSGRFSPLKATVLAAAFVPALLLAADFARGALGPRPLTEAIHGTGDWAIRFLLLSLAVTPFRRIFHYPKLILVRRMIGLATLSYALLHLTLYIADQKFDLVLVATEIVVRLYLTIGFLALTGLIVLGATSTDAAIRRLGGNWSRLHSIVYAIAMLGLIHYFMQTKADVYQATLLSGFFIILMLYRLAHWRGFDVRSPLVLGALAVVGALLTVLAEFTWYATATGIPPMRVLAANLQFAYQIRPAWWVLAAGLCVAVASFVRGRFAEPQEPRRRAEAPA